MKPVSSFYFEHDQTEQTAPSKPDFFCISKTNEIHETSRIILHSRRIRADPLSRNEALIQKVLRNIPRESPTRRGAVADPVEGTRGEEKGRRRNGMGAGRGPSMHGRETRNGLSRSRVRERGGEESGKERTTREFYSVN